MRFTFVDDVLFGLLSAKHSGPKFLVGAGPPVGNVSLWKDMWVVPVPNCLLYGAPVCVDAELVNPP
jgi:hypothetical protein